MEVSSACYQSMSSHPRELEEVFDGCPKVQQPEKKSRPHPEKALKCPRCDSTNTKFCYYNNYSLSQPRYFCKGCRRYWTQGGSLRNVPVGGGCRKNKRSTNSSSKKAHEQALTTNSNQLLPTLPYDPSDLTRAFVRLHSQPTTRHLGFDHHDPFLPANPNPNHQPNTNIPTEPGFLDIVRNGFLTTTNPSGFHNFYYGFGGPGSVEEVEGGVGGQEVVLPVEQGLDGATTAASTPITTSTTQGSSKLVDGGESKVMMGLQWQLGGDGTIAVDSGRDLWTGVNSSWHGLIHGSLL